jgi:predicted small integral membrane protein
MNEVNKNAVFLVAIISALTIFGGLFISQVTVHTSFFSLTALVIAIVCFVNTEVALYILIIAMLLGPQFVAGGGSEIAAARGRELTLRVDDFLLLVIGASWFAKTAIKKELGLFLKTPLNRPIAYYFIACVVSTVLGVMMGRVKPAAGFFFVMKYFEYFIVYFMAVNHLKEKKQIERFVLTMLFVCFIVCVIGMLQIPSGVRVSAPFEGTEGEPNTLGGYLVLMLSITLGLLLTGGLSKFKAFFYVLVGCVLITLAATLSRTSWISLLPIAFTLFYFSKRKMVIVITLLLLLVSSPFLLPKPVVDRALFIVGQQREAGQIQIGNVRIDTSTSARIESWKNVLLKDFYRNAIFGYGVTGYFFLDAQYPRVLIESGFIGLITFFILLGAIFKNALLAYRSTDDPLFSGLSLGYLAGFMALLTHAIGANTFIIVRIMEPFWFLTAMIIMIPSLDKVKTHLDASKS